MMRMGARVCKKTHVVRSFPSSIVSCHNNNTTKSCREIHLFITNFKYMNTRIQSNGINLLDQIIFNLQKKNWFSLSLLVSHSFSPIETQELLRVANTIIIIILSTKKKVKIAFKHNRIFNCFHTQIAKYVPHHHHLLFFPLTRSRAGHLARRATVQMDYEKLSFL